MKKKNSIINLSDKGALQYWSLLGIAIFIIAILWGVAIKVGLVESIDGFRYFFYGHRGSAQDKLGIFITHLGSSYFVIIISILMLGTAAINKIFRNSRGIINITNVATLLIITIISVIGYILLKMVFQRPRPDVILWLVHERGFSYPSGHSMNCMVFYASLMIILLREHINGYIKKLAMVLFPLLIILIGLSRIYVGVHYPTDVIGGWLFGSAILILSWKVALPVISARGKIKRILESRDL